MPLYDYQAVAGSKIEKGSIDAADEAAVTSALRAAGKYPVKISRSRVREGSALSIGERVPQRRLAAFCVQLSTMLGAGVALEQSLEMCWRQAGDARLKRALSGALEDIRGGHSLLSAFRRQTGRFPEILLNMVEAGETSGTLDVCLRRAGESLARSARLSAKIRGALVYPSFLLVLMTVIVAFLTVFVIPQFVGLYEKRGAEIPALTRALIAISSGARSYGLYWLLGAAALFVFWRFWRSTERGRLAWDKFKLRLPLWGKTSATLMAARYARSMATMLSAGVPLTRALDISGRALGNRFAQSGIECVIEDVRNGRPVSSSLEEQGIFPPLLVHMTRMGEESGKTEELLEQAALFFEEESESAVQRVVTLIEPAVILLMGGLVLLVVLAVIVPMFNMYSLI